MSSWEKHKSSQCSDACFYCKRDGISRPLQISAEPLPRRAVSPAVLAAMAIATGALVVRKP